jgi:hypothetical protein
MSELHQVARRANASTARPGARARLSISRFLNACLVTGFPGLAIATWLATGIGCRPLANGSPKEVEEDGTKSACVGTPDCRGGEFCDRGRCAALGTHDDYGHGYGAQCVDEEFYPAGMRDLHCRSYECVDGHCSSCISDSECEPGYACAPAPSYSQYPDRPPDYPGQRCTNLTAVQNPPVPCGVPANPVSCGPIKPQLPEPPLVANEGNECRKAKDCRGDEFCNRGRCAAIMVNPNGHGYGAILVRREPANLQDTCLGYLSIGTSCSSCLADSECYPEAPYCVHHPARPEGRSCAPHAEFEYYDASGKVAPTFSTGLETPASWLADYRNFREYHERYRSARAALSLPVPPPLPPLAGASP